MPSEFSVARLLPSAVDASRHRFPAQGRSYIEVPHEAFRSQGECARRWGARPPLPAALSPRRVVRWHWAEAPPTGLACPCTVPTVLLSPQYHRKLPRRSLAS